MLNCHFYFIYQTFCEKVETKMYETYLIVIYFEKCLIML